MKMTYTGRAIGLLAALLILAGCSLAPHYEVPDMRLPVAWKEAPATGADGAWKAAEPAEAAARGEWWKLFGDSRLDALETEAMSANQNLRAAAARLQQSRSLLGTAKADRLPQIGAGFGPTRQRPSPASQGLPPDADTGFSRLWRAQGTVSYEADLFGRVAASVDAARADAAQNEALFRSLQLALQADVANAWFQLRELDAEQALFDRTQELRGRNLKLAQQRFDAGDVGELDLARAQTEYASAQSQAQGVALQRATTEHALALLLGKTPAELDLAALPLERMSLRLPAGLPSSLLERRPDIAAAERAMAAANARIGVARSAFFPSLVITGSAGYESAGLGDLFNWSSRSFLLGPLAGTMLNLPIFDGGRRGAALDRAWAAHEEQVANYRQSVLNAFREVEDGLAGLRLIDARIQAQDEAVKASRRALELARTQYREGYTSSLEALDADRSLLEQQRLAVQLDGERARTTVGLIRALGGGWQGLEAAPRGEAEAGPGA
ncbi:efflux transporter outer membrane subunit [Uliginosibacterium paludis]|uniref:Efflux transporter outer membrane subunit n=1 Tax=Uliginosibacterium paludis TaxID=1615952 RepID=A0ABV2CP64_9RHOO